MALSEWEKRLSEINDKASIDVEFTGFLSDAQSENWGKWEYYMRRKNTFYFRDNISKKINFTIEDEDTLRELYKMKYHSFMKLDYETA